MLQVQKTWMATAVRRILRPVIRLLIAYDLNLPWLVSQLKELYVDVAVEVLSENGKRPPQSRVSLVTGVHRKDVKKLIDDPPDPADPPPANRIERMLGRWMGDDQFLDKKGKPLPLPRAAAKGQASFQALADSVSKRDINDGTIFRDLLDRGIISLDTEERVVLNVDALVPDKKHDLESLAYYLGKNEGDHLAAGVNNLIHPERPFLDRAVHHDYLVQEDVLALEKMARKESLALMKKLNREAHRMAAKREGDERFNFGVYFFHETIEEKEENPS